MAQSTAASRSVLTYRPDPEANSIAWLVWHLTRIQDDHVADVAGTEQQWLVGGWHERFGLPFPASATGYGQSSDEVAQVDVDSSLLLGYFDAVHEQTIRYVSGLRADDLDRIVDERWDPPVSLGVRLVSVIDDDLEHAGPGGVHPRTGGARRVSDLALVIVVAVCFAVAIGGFVTGLRLVRRVRAESEAANAEHDDDHP